MQVNSSGLSPQIIQQSNNTQTNSQQAERAAEQAREQQKQQAEQQRVNRIDVDQNAIAVLERENQQRFNANAQGDGASNSTSYDRPNNQNNTAIAAYQSVDNIERRDNVQQLLGVDLFA